MTEAITSDFKLNNENLQRRLQFVFFILVIFFIIFVIVVFVILFIIIIIIFVFIWEFWKFFNSCISIDSKTLSNNSVDTRCITSNVVRFDYETRLEKSSIKQKFCKIFCVFTFRIIS